jgi:hypothetical protein
VNINTDPTLQLPKTTAISQTTPNNDQPTDVTLRIIPPSTQNNKYNQKTNTKMYHHSEAAQHTKIITEKLTPPPT